MRHPAPLMLGFSDGLGPPPLALVQGGSLRTWSYRDAAVARVQVLLTSDGLPLDADLELWHGPTNAPCKVGHPILDKPLHCPWHTRRQRHTWCTPPPTHNPKPEIAGLLHRCACMPRTRGSAPSARRSRRRAAPTRSASATSGRWSTRLQSRHPPQPLPLASLCRDTSPSAFAGTPSPPASPPPPPRRPPQTASAPP